MSRIGANPLPIPEGVKVQLKDNVISVEKKGAISWAFPRDLTVKVSKEEIVITRPSDSKTHKSLHGLTRGIIKNMLVGVTDGHSKKLEVAGVGYRWKMEGKNLNLQLGFSHPVNYTPPAGIEINVIDNTNLTISGVDKQLVGQVAADIRKFRPPEPYKGKGIRYSDERIWRKAGKTAAK